MNPKKHLKQIRQLSANDDKTKGYGNDPQKFIDPLLPWFKIITYKKGLYFVIDRYSGEEVYIGETVTFYRKRPIYGLNYYGILIDRKFKAQIVWKFLKKALRADLNTAPHRGLNGFTENKWLYTNTFTETRGFIQGEEQIFYNDSLIYTLVYHGGIIEDSRSYKKWSEKLLTLKNK